MAIRTLYSPDAQPEFITDGIPMRADAWIGDVADLDTLLPTALMENDDWTRTLHHLWIAALGGERNCQLLVRLIEDDSSPAQADHIKHIKTLLTGIRGRFEATLAEVKDSWMEMRQALNSLQTTEPDFLIEQ